MKTELEVTTGVTLSLEDYNRLMDELNELRSRSPAPQAGEDAGPWCSCPGDGDANHKQHQPGCLFYAPPSPVSPDGAG